MQKQLLFSKFTWENAS